MTAADLSVLAPPRIDAATWTRELTARRSPCAADPTLYPIPLAFGIDPAVALAFFIHESQAGTAGTCATRDLKNWGNVRQPMQMRRGVMDSSNFFKFSSWAEGLRDWCERITIRYVSTYKASTVRTILKIYAPTSDGNVPDAYADAVCSLVARWQQGTPMASPWPPTIDRSFFPANWQSPRTYHLQAIIAHGTVGSDSRKYLQRGGELPDGSDRMVSIHALIAKAGTIYRMVNDDHVANHAGFGTMPKGYIQTNPNFTTLGFELENMQDGKDPYPDTQLLAMGWLINDWRRLYGPLPVLRHADIDPTRRKDTTGLTVAQIEGWCVKAGQLSAPPLRLMRVKDPISTDPADNFLAIREARTVSAPVALGGTAKLLPGATVQIRDIVNGWAHLDSAVGFVNASYLEPA